MMAEKTGYEIAVERIEEVARTGATELDLSGLGLTKVPDNLLYVPGDLTLLEPKQPITLISPSRHLRVLILHDTEDKKTVLGLYTQLSGESWMDIRLEEASIFPNQKWDSEREKVIEQTDVVVVCFSSHTMDKAERLPRELVSVLRILETMPEGAVFMVPLRLDDCEVPYRFEKLQYADYFPQNNQEWAYQRLLESLKLRARNISVLTPATTFLRSRPFSVFLCHAKHDKPIVHGLYNQLLAESWIDVWVSDFKLLPGQDWGLEIYKAIDKADIVIVCMSTHSVMKTGYYQKELKEILSIAYEKQNRGGFVVPLRLDDCQMPSPFLAWQHIDYFPRENQDSTYYSLVKMIKAQAIEVIPERFERRNLKLNSLDLSKNQLAALPVDIGQFSSLTELDLDWNKLITLSPEIGQLTNLTWLDLSHNQLASLPTAFGQLANLTSLDLSDNQFTSLPLFLKNLNKFTELNARNNPLPVPPEILEKVLDPKIVLNYLVELWAGQRRPLAETKMLVVGQGSVGKTSLIHRLIDNSFSSSEIKTDGISINRWQVQNTDKGENQPTALRVNIWDFGGQEIMHATHQFFLTRRSLYMLVLDSRISQEENRVEYWLKIIESFGGESPVLIVGNKIDQHPLDIDRTGLQKKYPSVIGILETSAVDGAGLKELKLAIAEQVNKLPHVRDSLPEVWFNVKNQLELLGQAQNYISQEKYTATCVEGEIRDDASQRTLIGFLHDLGVVLHFQDDPHLESLGILNPQWVTNGVYKILNARDVLDNKGVMTLTMLNEILNSPQYPSDKRLFIVEMMRKFELCYDIDREQFLVPDLLPKSEPFVGEKEWDGALAFQYHYNVLPSSIITRFIVRMNTNGYIHKTVWRSGVVLQKDGNTALVKADIEDKKIYIWVNGAENTRRDFLSVIRAEFDAIHKTIIKIEAVQKVPHPDHPELILDYEELLKFEQKQIPEFQRSVKDDIITVNVRQLLNGVRVGDVPALVAEPVAPPVPTPVVAPKPEPAAVPAPQLSLPMKILHWVFVEFPKAIGRIPLDIIGKGKDAADTTTVPLGYVIIILAVLVWFGYINFDALLTWLKDTWRFFFPLKP